MMENYSRIWLKSEKVHCKKSNWFSKNGKYKSFMFVDTTPGSELKNRIQKAADKKVSFLNFAKM